MRILHTSDWHIGALLYGRKRHDQHMALMEWLLKELQEKQVDVLLICGDIFDSTTPGNRSQQIYYHFLNHLSQLGIQVVITGGNHDSPSFLNAPSALLKSMKIHVIGGMTENLEEQLILMEDRQGTPQGYILAVPFLRERDVRRSLWGESWEEKEKQLALGIKTHYQDLFELAQEKNLQRSKQGQRPLPILATGHLFVRGGSPGEGVRDLYVGNLGQLNQDIFPEGLLYTALGHLHLPQALNSQGTMNYCGSPLPMGFGEAEQQKQMILVEWKENRFSTEVIEVPGFQELIRLKGDFEVISQAIMELKSRGSQAWLELHYNGETAQPNLATDLQDLVDQSSLQICRIINESLKKQQIIQADFQEDLEDLNTQEIFQRCLEEHEIPEDQWQEYKESYQEIILHMEQQDSREND
ncbi:MAG: exonuclease SbcCD subunit D C-terminal domain-containing protein [Spirochaetaceae bacterium]|jgi:exonuclease SbcD|nr:exonuclease SbcCD subunit D C-terminal domain-containing protein [Spirochaetaceae bacterium]